MATKRDKPLSKETFLRDINDFVEETGMRTTALGLKALNDPSFYGKLKRGTSPTLDRIEKVYEFMAAHRKGETPPAGKETLHALFE